MALWRASILLEDWLEDVAAKGVIPPNEVAGWRAPLAENELPVLEVEEIASLVAFHERGLGYPAHDFLRGLLHHWEIKLQHLNPNRILHLAGFMMVCEVFLGVDANPILLRHYFITCQESVTGEKNGALVGGFRIQHRPKREGDYPAYIHTDSNRWWHGEWFYLKNHEVYSFSNFIGRHPTKLPCWSWGIPGDK